MAFFDLFRRKSETSRGVRAQTFSGFDDPAFLEFIRAGGASTDQLRNMAVLRCLQLISGTIGMLPINLFESGPEKRIAREHPGYRLLKVKPNSWQTPLEFKRQMQLSLLRYGNAYAQILRSGGRPVALVPLDSTLVQADLSGYRMTYRVSTDNGEHVLPQSQVFHLRDMSVDGETGLSRMKLADDVIRLAQDAQKAAANVFKTGNMAGGAVEVPNALSDQAYARMKAGLDSDYAGAANANRWMLLEEGAKANKFSSTAQEAQQIENRNHQIEEVARLFGVPRPLLMMDDTSWGSGIEQLGIFFVQYTMLEHFTNWEQAAARSLLEDSELEDYQFKFNERALMRGTLKDQADFFAKALGAGGQSPFLTQNEIRELQDYPRSDDPGADELRNPMTQQGEGDEPAEAA